MGIKLAGKLTICHEYSNDLCACSDKECKSAGLVLVGLVRGWGLIKRPKILAGSTGDLSI